MRLQKEGSDWYRLHLVSNWQWRASDPLGPLLRESSGGALPEKFFTAGPATQLGLIRKKWQGHLGLGDTAFEDFARRLRIDVNFLARGYLREWLSDRLALAGLKGLRKDQAQNVYDSLVQSFVMNGENEFDAAAFRELCIREELFDNAPPPPVGPPVIGIRSFMRFAERMEGECQKFVCVTEHFDGRHVRDQDLWQETILNTTKAFLQDPSYREQEHHLLLDCHTSLAFLAGYELDRKSGAKVYPVQKGANGGVWKPSGGVGASDENGGWLDMPTELGATGEDVAIAVSVTRDVLDAVRTHASKNPEIGVLVDIRPESGVGASSIKGPDHALALADSLSDLIRKHRSKGGGTVHPYVSAPNALTFFLAQHRGALGKIQLYEFDFEGERGCSYSPSIRLPA